MDRTIILTFVGVIITLILGYLIGKNTRRDLKPKGDIVFEMYYDNEDEEERARCTFKLDMDLDEMVLEDYILFGVVKDQKVLDYYEKEKQKE